MELQRPVACIWHLADNTGMTNPWPLWARLPAEEVRNRIPNIKDRGPWTEGRKCVRGSPAVLGNETETLHDAEPPWFYHCGSCMSSIRNGTVTRPDIRRDNGLCIKCEEPAEYNKKYVRADSRSAMEAEAQDVTIARLNTRKFCKACDPFSKPYCHTRACLQRARKGKARARVEQCGHGHKVAHCRQCCEEATNKNRIQNAQGRALYRSRAEQGLCPVCGKNKPIERKKLCVDCAAYKDRARAKRRRAVTGTATDD